MRRAALRTVLVFAVTIAGVVAGSSAASAGDPLGSLDPVVSTVLGQTTVVGDATGGDTDLGTVTGSLPSTGDVTDGLAGDNTDGGGDSTDGGIVGDAVGVVDDTTDSVLGGSSGSDGGVVGTVDGTVDGIVGGTVDGALGGTATGSGTTDDGSGTASSGERSARDGRSGGRVREAKAPAGTAAVRELSPLATGDGRSGTIEPLAASMRASSGEPRAAAGSPADDGASSAWMATKGISLLVLIGLLAALSLALIAFSRAPVDVLPGRLQKLRTSAGFEIGVSAYVLLAGACALLVLTHVSSAISL